MEGTRRSEEDKEELASEEHKGKKSSLASISINFQAIKVYLRVS
jgi:hypothetical protein